jgi:presqualene diphosphate synthase
MSLRNHSHPAERAPAPVARQSSFYLAMRILPPEQREAMYAIYAFCRAVDDIADDGGPEGRRIAKLDDWRDAISGLYKGKPTDLTSELAPAVKRFGLRRDDFLAVIDGMEMDVRGTMRQPDWQTLDLYCDRVASAVGRLSVKVYGIEDAEGILLSRHLGRALQMTNILRDVDEDAELGRLYLPAEALANAGIEEVDIAGVLAHPKLGQACMTVALRAKEHFAQASAVMAECSDASVRSPRIMASVYRALLDRLVRRGWKAPRERMRPSRLQFLGAVVRHGIM